MYFGQILAFTLIVFLANFWSLHSVVIFIEPFYVIYCELGGEFCSFCAFVSVISIYIDIRVHDSTFLGCCRLEIFIFSLMYV